MTITNGLLTTDDYAAYTNATPAVAGRYTQWEEAIEIASRWVERHTGRQFHETDPSGSPTASARYFDAVGRRVTIDDCQSITLVETDTGDDGTYATTVTAYQALPVGGRDNLLGSVPYTSLISLSTSVWPCENYRKGAVKVTGLWGWTAVPDDVKRATAIFAQDLLRDSETNYGGLQVDTQNGVVIGSRVPSRVLLLLEPFVRLSRAPGVRVA